LNSQVRAAAPSIRTVGHTAVDDGGGDAASKLRHLDDLHQRGLISNEEYQATRKRIIRGL
jgi:hypothetical protein